MKFSLLNAQSARNKTNILNEYIVNDNINIAAAITETWFTPDDEQLSNDITPKGYEIYHVTRDGRRGGGVALIAKSRFKPSAFPTQTFASFESLSVKLSMKKPPSSQPQSTDLQRNPLAHSYVNFKRFSRKCLNFEVIF